LRHESARSEFDRGAQFASDGRTYVDGGGGIRADGLVDDDRFEVAEVRDVVDALRIQQHRRAARGAGRGHPHGRSSTGTTSGGDRHSLRCLSLRPGETDVAQATFEAVNALGHWGSP